MPYGSETKYLKTNKLMYNLINLLGTLDLHSQIRMKPVLKFIKNNLKDELTYNALELGCNLGLLGIELNKTRKHINYYGIDKNESSINAAKEISIKSGYSNFMKFECIDLSKNNFIHDKTIKYDIILLIDFIEHISNPKDILLQLKPFINNGGHIIISVPTKNYLKVFGKAFDKKVGHIKDGGYSINELSELLNIFEGEFVNIKFNTGLLSNIGCTLFYRNHFKNRFAEYLKAIMLYVFKYFDIINNPKISSSLFVVYKLN